MKKIYGAFIACLALALPALAADETEGYHTARPAAAGCLENDTAIGQKFEEINTTSGFGEKPDTINRDELTNTVHLIYPSGTVDITLDEDGKISKLTCSFMRSSR